MDFVYSKTIIQTLALSHQRKSQYKQQKYCSQVRIKVATANQLGDFKGASIIIKQ